MNLYDSITTRKSTRKYTQQAVPPEQLASIKEFVTNMKPLIPGIRTDIKLVGAADVKGMVSAKTPHYLLVYSETKDGYLANAGFLLQQADLFVSSLGLGSCWLGVAKTKAPAQNGMDYVIMLAFGVAQDSPHRQSLSQFNRKPLADLAKGQDQRLEAVRLAPSAANSQPWYFVCGEQHLDVYRQKLGVIKAAIYDKMNQIDMGIALCHLWLASEQMGLPFAFSLGQPQGATVVEGYGCIGRVGGEE